MTAIVTAEAVRYRTVGEILEVVRGFETRTLPRERWKHAEHLTVALWYLLQFDFSDAAARVRRGIELLNEAHGGENIPERGYHETITIFWLRYVASFLDRERNEGRALVKLANELIGVAERDLPLEFYTRSLLFSTEARTVWVEPDLKDFPF